MRKGIILSLLRISLGWLFFYAGITKVLDPSWSASGFLNNAATFPEFYKWLGSPSILPAVNFLNEWGLTFLGISLVLGVGVRLSGFLGAILMALYYFPGLKFPFLEHGFLVDDHIIYIFVLLFLATSRAGKCYSLENWFSSKCPNLHKLIG